jgi:putative tryptophan/tyrosine transport system substrate-binding protein
MRRRAFIAMGCGAILWSRSGRAQPVKKVPRLCFLTFDPGTPESPAKRFEAFFEGLHDLGYVHGQSIAIDYLHPEGRSDRYSELAAGCLRLKPDIIAVTTTPGAQALQSATSTIPIVMVALGDPVGTKLVDSLNHPGGNITGMSQMTSGLAAKRLELLKEAVPGLSHVLVLTYLVDPISPLQIQALKSAAPALNVTLHVVDIKTPDDLPAAFDAGIKAGAQGVLTTAESIFRGARALVTELAAQHKLPAIYPYAAFALSLENGGLMAYDVTDRDLHRSAANYVDKILKGAKPSDLAVQQPTKFQLVINLRTAKTLGLTIPPSLLARADEVVE